MRGPQPNLRITKVVDPESGALVAYTITGLFGNADRTIWLDGRSHPSALAEHTWGGFSTGEWVGDALKVTTSHIKAGTVQRNGVPASPYATMTEYEAGLPVNVISPKPAPLKNILGKVVSDAGIAQFRCAETEKNPHVTFFFNTFECLIDTANVFSYMTHIAAELSYYLSVYLRKIFITITFFFCPLRKIANYSLEIFDAIFTGFHGIVAQVFALCARV